MVVIVIVDVTMHRKFWLLKNWKKKKKPKITNVDGLSVNWSTQFWIFCYFLNFGGVRNAYKIYLWPLGQLKLPGISNHDVQGLSPLPHLRCIKRTEMQIRSTQIYEYLMGLMGVFLWRDQSRFWNVENFGIAYVFSWMFVPHSFFTKFL